MSYYSSTIAPIIMHTIGEGILQVSARAAVEEQSEVVHDVYCGGGCTNMSSHDSRVKRLATET